MISFELTGPSPSELARLSTPKPESRALRCGSTRRGRGFASTHGPGRRSPRDGRSAKLRSVLIHRGSIRNPHAKANAASLRHCRLSAGTEERPFRKMLVATALSDCTTNRQRRVRDDEVEWPTEAADVEALKLLTESGFFKHPAVLRQPDRLAALTTSLLCQRFRKVIQVDPIKLTILKSIDQPLAPVPCALMPPIADLLEFAVLDLEQDTVEWWAATRAEAGTVTPASGVTCGCKDDKFENRGGGRQPKKCHS